MITSVEPGIYFIEALLADPAVRERFAEEVVWDAVEPLRGFGGIRIEDDIHVTAAEPEVLSEDIGKPIRIA
jgi:Xaa-Pro aminopeptidase